MFDSYSYFQLLRIICYFRSSKEIMFYFIYYVFILFNYHNTERIVINSADFILCRNTKKGLIASSMSLHIRSFHWDIICQLTWKFYWYCEIAPPDGIQSLYLILIRKFSTGLFKLFQMTIYVGKGKIQTYHTNYDYSTSNI